MKKIIIRSLLLTSIFTISCSDKNSNSKEEKYMTQTITEGNYSYEIVTNDPTNTRVYTLKNGLKVYLSVYKDAPRIQTFIPVRAGSKNDPAHATGLAHYLEHMVFKGTSKIGALNWENEKPLLDKIESLYEQYRQTTDEEQRKLIYSKIDSVSGEAAKFASANEYDKILTSLGAKGTNAFTSMERTVYVNDIPSNQLERWLETESERFREVTPRLFHTELEAVYEEKNRSLDNDFRKVWEAALSTLFQKHQYGTQTTIGTIEHLKNPSITEIKKYFYSYYVPNNMAICLSGDLDPTKTIELVDKYFGGHEQKEVPTFEINKEEDLSENITKEVFGPDAEMLLLGYKLPAKKHNDIPALKVLNQILSNGQTGLIDKNLNQDQKVLDATSYQWLLNDYSLHFIYATAREGQELNEVHDLLMQQIDSLKNGQFKEWIIDAAVNNMKVNKMRSNERNSGRAFAMVDAFIENYSWEEKLKEFEGLEKVTKDDVVKVANQYFGNHVTIFKRNGEDPNKQEVEKPQITPVAVNRDSESEFYKSIKNKSVESIKPSFVDYASIEKMDKNGVEFLYMKNVDNETFDLYYLVDMGKNHDLKIELAVNYLKYLGTDKYSLNQLNDEFFKLGSKYYTYTSNDEVYVSVRGLQENFEATLDLFEHLIRNARVDTSAYNKMVKGILKERTDAKLSKEAILYGALTPYGKYGKNNPFNTILNEQELMQVNPQDLVQLLKELFNYKHRVMYYGSGSKEEVFTIIDKKHEVPAVLKDLLPEKKYDYLDFSTNKVFWVNYDMVQTEIVMLSKSVDYNSELTPKIQLFNEYFGGGMGSIVFQELRESRALAYGVRSRYTEANKKDEPNFMWSYIGTQADKLPEALKGMNELLNEMPKSDIMFENSKNSILNKIETERITKTAVFFNYINATKKGLNYDIRKNIYDSVSKYTFEDIQSFQNELVKNKNQHILVIGSKDKLDFETLSKYGEIKEVTLEELFGY